MKIHIIKKKQQQQQLQQIKSSHNSIKTFHSIKHTVYRFLYKYFCIIIYYYYNNNLDFIVRCHIHRHKLENEFMIYI